ncbi:hypothetical protein ALC60_12852, partial [Trachymyrmex zeteki]
VPVLHQGRFSRVLLNSPESGTSPVLTPRPASRQATRRPDRPSALPFERFTVLPKRRDRLDLSLTTGEASVRPGVPGEDATRRDATGRLRASAKPDRWPKVRGAHRSTWGTAHKRRSLRRGSQEGSRFSATTLPPPIPRRPAVPQGGPRVQTARAEGYFETIKFREITWFLITNTVYYV